MQTQTRPLPENLRKSELAKHIIAQTKPKPSEPDSWAFGLFEEDPDEDSMSRVFCAFGKLKDCVDAVAGALVRKPSASRMRIISVQADIPEIDCRANDFAF